MIDDSIPGFCKTFSHSLTERQQGWEIADFQGTEVNLNKVAQGGKSGQRQSWDTTPKAYTRGS